MSVGLDCRFLYLRLPVRRSGRKMFSNRLPLRWTRPLEARKLPAGTFPSELMEMGCILLEQSTKMTHLPHMLLIWDLGWGRLRPGLAPDLAPALGTALGPALGPAMGPDLGPGRREHYAAR